MDQQTAEARLQMLEAQIEPHFLFNALANVKRLYDTDPTGGARMLRNLKDYLAVALPAVAGTEYMDPEFLQQLRPLATRFVLLEGESKTLALTLKKRP